MKYIRSRAPLRIGLAGGGTDVDPYASEKGGAVFNTTINKYAYCTIIPNGTNTVSAESVNYGMYESNLDGGPLPLDGNMDLVKAVLNYFEIKDGFRMLLITFSWEVTTTPVSVTGLKPTASITIDSTKADKTKLAALEDILYGGEENEARLPLPDEVITLMGETAEG